MDYMKDYKNRVNSLLMERWGYGKKKVEEEAKPDFLDLDKDGDKEESMKSAAAAID